MVAVDEQALGLVRDEDPFVFVGDLVREFLLLRGAGLTEVGELGIRHVDADDIPFLEDVILLDPMAVDLDVLFPEGLVDEAKGGFGEELLDELLRLLAGVPLVDDGFFHTRHDCTIVRARGVKKPLRSIPRSPIILFALSAFGGIPKWSKGRAWKARRLVTGRWGSNPHSSANRQDTEPKRFRFFLGKGAKYLKCNFFTLNTKLSYTMNGKL